VTVDQFLSNNIGIGGAATARQVMIYGGAGNALTQFVNTATGTGLSNGTFFGLLGGGSDFFFTQQANAKIILQTNNTNAATIQASGGIFVGTSSSTDPGAGALLVNTSIKSQGATAGIGYATGSGGAVVQATSKATGVTLNTVNGSITMNNASLAAGTIVTFTLIDSALAATDVISANHISGGTTGAYTINCRASGAGTGACDVRNNTAGALAEAVVIEFVVIKGVTN
jgi:hypothetical protein